MTEPAQDHEVNGTSSFVLLPYLFSPKLFLSPSLCSKQAAVSALSHLHGTRLKPNSNDVLILMVAQIRPPWQGSTTTVSIHDRRTPDRSRGQSFLRDDGSVLMNMMPPPPQHPPVTVSIELNGKQYGITQGGGTGRCGDKEAGNHRLLQKRAEASIACPDLSSSTVVAFGVMLRRLDTLPHAEVPPPSIPCPPTIAMDCSLYSLRIPTHLVLRSIVDRLAILAPHW
mmetsp:Transcript_21460/g.59700  ORF Transcript_21460/g.59700 Transcript_21460/m.59700 type:complete len:226 (-) Transcript_21460:1452-2129(-)